MKIKKLFFVRAGNYAGSSHDDKGLTRVGREQAREIALRINKETMGASPLVITGRTARMIQSARIVAKFLNANLVTSHYLDPGNEHEASMTIRGHIVRCNDAGFEILIFFSCADVLDDVVRTLDGYFPQDFRHGLKLPPLGAGAAYGSDCHSDIGEGQAWFVDVEKGVGTVIGKDHSKWIGRPGMKFALTR